MARPLRVLIPDGIYHVTARGLDRRSIYRSDADRLAFLDVLERTVSRFDWRCLSYCLMDNHFHLVLRTPQPNLDRGMQQLNSRYAQMFNRRYARGGPLFDSRYGAVLVQRGPHALEVFRYVALNPARAGFCERPGAWPWSAHGALAGLAPEPPFLAAQEARNLFESSSGTDGRLAYVDYVALDEGADRMPDVAVVGDEPFLRETLAPVERDAEIPRRYWGPGRPSIMELMDADDMAAAMVRAYRQHGYTMATIAAHVGCHVSTVSRRIHAYERRMLDCKI
jgi:putative transposase